MQCAAAVQQSEEVGGKAGQSTPCRAHFYGTAVQHCITQWFSEPVDVSQAVPLQQPDICASPLTPTAINFALFRGQFEAK